MSPRRPAFVGKLLFLLACLSLGDVSAADLVGEVHSTGGSPVAGATVFVYSAGPQTGTSPLCPTCYVDCGKTAKSDAEGQFALPRLSTELVFRLLVVAPGFEPQFVPGVKPAKGQVTVQLKPRGPVAEGRLLRGRVVDTSGQPLVGAVVEAYGIRTRDGRGSWGSLESFGIDKLAVTDGQGVFAIVSRDDFASLDVKVAARAHANRTFARLANRPTVHTLVMTEGATLSGRVVRDGRPVPNVGIGVKGVDTDLETYVGHFEVGTDAEGRFTLVNLPPNTEYYLYGLMETVRAFGAIPHRVVKVGADDSHTKTGDVAVQRGRRVTGRVVLAEGEKIPTQTRLLFSRDDAWDSVAVELGPDGTFDLGGVPAGETVSLTVEVAGYRTSSRNRSFDPLNGTGLIGKVPEDITGLQFLLEKGPMLRPDHRRNYTEAEFAAMSQHHPLRGTETDGP